MSEPLNTIAIANPEPTGVLALRQITDRWKYACSGVASSGLEALALVQLYKPQVLLLDAQIVGLSGLDTLRQIIPFKTTAVVFVTNDADSDLCTQAMDMGAAAFLLKPFDAFQVRAVLQTAWHRYQGEHLLHQEIDALKDGLETRKLIDRAKGILIAERGVTEPEAYRLLQKMSQDKRVSIKEVCRAVDQIRMVVGLKAKTRTAL